jgi:hypothetical protein
MTEEYEVLLGLTVKIKADNSWDAREKALQDAEAGAYNEAFAYEAHVVNVSQPLPRPEVKYDA